MFRALLNGSLMLCLAFFVCVDRVFAETKAPVSSPLAPADEYFGRLKMSVLSIHSILQTLGANAGADETADALLGKAIFVQDAICDWERKYPKDSDIPENLTSLMLLYQKIDLDAARVRGVETEYWLLSRYAHTSFAQRELKRIAERNAFRERSPDEITQPPTQ